MGYFSLLFKLYRSKRNLKMTAEQLKVLQEQRLHRLLKFAYENSPYYRGSFESAGINDKNINTMPLEKFPVTDKKVLIDNFDSLVTVRGITQNDIRSFDENSSLDKKLFKNNFHIVHSSGSTGTPCYFLYDKKAWNTMLAGIIRAALWDMSMPQIFQFLAQGPRIAYIAASDGRYGGAMAVGDGIDGLKASSLFLDIKTPLSEWTEKINKFKPNMIIGYPSALKILGELFQSGKIKHNIFRVITCGEPLGKSMRAFFENIFDSSVINFYGASESLALGVEANSSGMYLFDDMNVIEAAPDGIYITCLYNFAQPLIRYKLSDRLIFKPRDTVFPLSKAENIFGRNEDMMWFENSNGQTEFLHPLAVEGICIDGLRDYQFRQISTGAFEVIAEAEDSKRDNVYSEMSKYLKNILNEKKLENVCFKVRFIKEIAPDKQTGKKKLIIPNEYRKGA